MASPPLDSSGGIGRMMAYLLQALPPESRPVKVFDTRGKGRPITSIVPLLNACVRLSQLLRHRGADLVHINISERGSTLRKLLVLEVASRFPVATVLHLHAGTFPRFFSSLPGPVKQLVRRGFRRASSVVVLGESWREYAADTLRVDPRRIFVLPNATDGPAELSPTRRPPNVPLRVVMLGRLGDLKGTQHVLHALASLPRWITWDAVLAGDGPSEIYEAKARDLGISGRVSFPGWIDTAAVHDLLQGAHVLLQPSRAEGLPMSVIEALSYGVPVIASPVGALTEVVRAGWNGEFVEWGDVAGISAALRRIAADEEYRFALACNARSSWDARFTIHRYSESIRAIWTSSVALSTEGRRERLRLIGDPPCVG